MKDLSAFGCIVICLSPHANYWFGQPISIFKPFPYLHLSTISYVVEKVNSRQAPSENLWPRTRLVPGSKTPLPRISTRLDLQSVSLGSRSHRQRVSRRRPDVHWTRVKRCLSSEAMVYGCHTTCAMISLAGTTAVSSDANAGAGNAFRRHELGRSSGRPSTFPQSGSITWPSRPSGISWNKVVVACKTWAGRHRYDL